MQFRISGRNIGKLNFVIIDVNLALYYVFFFFSLLYCKYKCDIYLSMMDSNGLCKLNKIFIYKITEDI